MQRPLFLVTQYGPQKRRNQASGYGYNMGGTDTWHRAGLIHGYFPGVGMDFYFESERDASRFSKWTLYDPSQIIQAATPQGQQYIVNNIWEGWYSLPNPYGGDAFKTQVWYVGMRAQNTRQELELRFPSEVEARRFSKGVPYTMTDLVGTLPAVPSDISDQLREAADQARFAQDQQRAFEEAIRRQQEGQLRQILEDQARADAAKYAPPPPPGTPPPPPPPPPPPAIGQGTTQYVFDILEAAGWHDGEPNDTSDPRNYNVDLAHGGSKVFDAIQQALTPQYGATVAGLVRNKFANDILFAEQAAISAGFPAPTMGFNPTGRDQGVPTYRNFLISIYGRPRPRTQAVPTDSIWFIVNGGARGNYDQVFFNTGTFHYSQSGLWFGTYILA